MGHHVSRPIAFVAVTICCQCKDFPNLVTWADCSPDQIARRHIRIKSKGRINNASDINLVAGVKNGASRHWNPIRRTSRTIPRTKISSFIAASLDGRIRLFRGKHRKEQNCSFDSERFSRRKRTRRQRPITSIMCSTVFSTGQYSPLIVSWNDVMTQVAYKNSLIRNSTMKYTRGPSGSSVDLSSEGENFPRADLCNDKKTKGLRQKIKRGLVMLFEEEEISRRDDRFEVKGTGINELSEINEIGGPKSTPPPHKDEDRDEMSSPSSSEKSNIIATDVDTLRSLFGRNRNKLWGDLDAAAARKLYQALLPRALLRLYNEGLAPDELAPLAYEARLAAKEYARERCQVPGRMAATAYDGFRHLRRYGKWSGKGLSWEQLWEKYEAQIKEEVSEIEPSLRQEELTSKVCLRILERSCTTNESIDKLLLSDSYVNQELARLDQEVEDILQRKKEDQSIDSNEFRLLRHIVRIRRSTREMIFEIIDGLSENLDE